MEAKYQKDVRSGSKLSLEMTWENSGVAPFYSINLFYFMFLN